MMSFFRVIGILGFIVFLVVMISSSKKRGSRNRYIIVSTVCFIVIAVGAVSAFANSKQEKKVNKTLDSTETIKKKIKTGISYSLYIKAKNTLNVKFLQNFLADYGSVGNILQVGDGFFVVLTDGQTVLETKDFKTMSEVQLYERELITKAKADKMAIEEMEKKAAAEIDSQDKSQMKANAQIIDYSSLQKDPYNYRGKNVKYTGEIVQILEGNGMTNILLAVTKKSYGYSLRDIIFVKYDDTTDFTENEIINVYGVIIGDYSYILKTNYHNHLPGILAYEMTKRK